MVTQHTYPEVRNVHLFGQPHAVFAIASAAEALCDKLQCDDADWRYQVMMTPSGLYVIAVETLGLGEDEPRFLGFV